MRSNKHFKREIYYVVGEEFLSVPSGLDDTEPSVELTESQLRERTPPFKFGRMFDKGPNLSSTELRQMRGLLVELGKAMSDLTPNGLLTGSTTPTTPLINASDSSIPAGYTYLALFLAHELTFDKVRTPPDPPYEPVNYRSPQVDLDSVYGEGPGSASSADLYEADGARLKIGQTQKLPKKDVSFPNDLLRDSVTRRAVIPDERNDENLAVAQMHVAFVRFHNYVVGELENTLCSKDQLFNRARERVVRCFHEIILEDLLPRLLDENVLKKVVKEGAPFFSRKTAADLFMPLEFSAAAYRFGHSMIRRNYQWNSFHSTQWDGTPAQLCELFELTELSGKIGKPEGPRAITSDWVIDWRRFFDFSALAAYPPPSTGLNHASRMDRVFNLHLESLPNFEHYGLVGARQFIQVRNLLRGLALGLPSGEFVAKELGESVLTTNQLLSGHSSLQKALDKPEFKQNTPLWYYIIKEAELNRGEKLGPVGSRIVAETIVGLIRRSKYSVSAGHSSEKSGFKMINLLHLADVVNPLGN